MAMSRRPLLLLLPSLAQRTGRHSSRRHASDHPDEGPPRLDQTTHAWSGGCPRACGVTPTRSLSTAGTRRSSSSRTIWSRRMSTYSTMEAIGRPGWVCHCTHNHACHADSLISLYRSRFPAAIRPRRPIHGASILGHIAVLILLREEPVEDDGSSGDEGAPPANSGWRGTVAPLMVGTGYTSREFCDGQTLASPGRWPVQFQRYPKSQTWLAVADSFMDFASSWGTPQMIMDLALGKVQKTPFDDRSIARRQDRPPDRLPIRPVTPRGQLKTPKFAWGQGARLPRFPHSVRRSASGGCRNSRTRPTTENFSPTAAQCGEGTTQRRQTFAKEVTAVFEDQASRDQVIALTEHQACDFRTLRSLPSERIVRTSPEE